MNQRQSFSFLMNSSVSDLQFVFSYWQEKTLSSWLVQQIKRKWFFSSDGSHSHSRVSFDLGFSRRTQSLAGGAMATYLSCHCVLDSACWSVRTC